MDWLIDNYMNNASISKYGSGILTLAALAAIALVSVACSDSGDEAISTVSIPRSSEFQTEEAEYGQYGVCYEPTESLREDLAQTLISDELGMRAFFMVRQPDDSISWTIAVDIEGPGLEGEGPIAILNGRGQTVPRITKRNVAPFNDVTLQYTTLETSLGRDIAYLEDAYALYFEENLAGIELIQSCLSQELETNPGTKVYERDH